MVFVNRRATEFVAEEITCSVVYGRGPTSKSAVWPALLLDEGGAVNHDGGAWEDSRLT